MHLPSSGSLIHRGQARSSEGKGCKAVPGSYRVGFVCAQRYASTSREIVEDSISIVTRLKNFLLGTVVGASLILAYLYITDTRAGVHQWIVVPSIRWIYDDAEDAHEAGTKALKALYEFGMHPRERGHADNTGDLAVEVSIALIEPNASCIMANECPSGLRTYSLQSNWDKCWH